MQLNRLRVARTHPPDDLPSPAVLRIGERGGDTYGGFKAEGPRRKASVARNNIGEDVVRWWAKGAVLWG